MGLMHKDEPVADAIYPCRECRATDWIVRTPRFGGDSSIVCRACGHDAGPVLTGDDFELTDDEYELEQAQHAFEVVTFPVHAPAGVPWRPTWGEMKDDVVEHVTLETHDRTVGVTSEAPGVEPDPVRSLAREVASVLWERYPPREGRSDAAYTLEVQRYEDTLDQEVGRLTTSTGTLRVEDREVPCTTMHHRTASAARADLGDVVVFAYAVGASLGDVVLTRVK